jgi:N-acetylneuraminate epimerase
MFMSMVAINCKEEIDEIEWSVSSNLPSATGMKEQPGLAGPVTGIVHDYLLVSGGANFPDGMPWRGAKKFYHDDIYLFEKRNGQDIVASVSKQKLPQPVAYCANVMIPEGTIYLGGENQQGILSRVVMIKYDDKLYRLVFSDLPALPLPLTNLSAACINHMIYAGGGNSTDGSSNKFFSLDISKPGNSWQSLPDIPVKMAYAVMVAQSDGDHNCIYLIGGRRKNNDGISEIFNTVYQFDIEPGQWKQKQSLPYRISAGTGIAYKSNQILLFGGDKGETFSMEERLSASIRYEKDEQKNKKLVEQKVALLDNHPGFTNEVLLYNTITDTWKKTKPLPSGAPVTTTAINWENDIIIPSGEIKAGVRTSRILMGKLKASR